MKKKAAPPAKKGVPTKKAAAPKKPTQKTPPGKAAAKTEPAKPPAPATETTRRTGTYTPTPVQGIGWAPFRYPPQ
jgi:hypothetical protein